MRASVQPPLPLASPGVPALALQGDGAVLPAAIPAAAAGRGWLVVPLIGAILSRGWSLLLLGVAARRDNEPLFGPESVTARWDASWYLRIAANGYHQSPIHVNALGGQHDYAFFPLWPGVIRAVSFLQAPPAVAAAILSPALFCVAAVLIAAALEPVFGRLVATDGVLLLAFSPGAWTFSMGYSEGLFLVFAAIAFLSTSPARRAVVVALAVVTRIAGLPLIAVDGLQWLRSRGRDIGALGVAFAGGLAFAGWWIAVAVISGDPMGFLRGSPDWGVVTGIWAVERTFENAREPLVAALIVVAIVSIGAIVTLRRSWRMGTYALLALGLGLLPGGLVSSMPRYALAAFPAFAGLASLGGRRGTAVLLVVAAIAQIAFVAWSFQPAGRSLPP
jgi:hypothetical protein